MYERIALASPSADFAQAVVVGLYDKTTRLPEAYAELDRRAGGALSAALGRAEFSAKAGALTTLYPAPDAKAGDKAGDKASAARTRRGGRSAAARGDGPQRLYVLGLGEAGKFKLDKLRKAAAVLLRAAFNAQVTQLQLQLTAGLRNGDANSSAEAVGRAVGDGLALANFSFESFLGAARPDDNAKPKKLRLQVQIDRDSRDGLERALTVGESVNLARTLAATPPNVANPRYVVDYCRKMAREVGLKYTLIDAKKAKQLKMGGLLAVGQAGSTPPAMVVLEWEGTKPSSHRATKGRKNPKSEIRNPKSPILLVGKAITFDTGGYSLKQTAGMLGMKYDKCGGMAVIGAMHAIARLKLPQRVVAIIAAAENMVDSTAYRPNDIITFCNGVTCEVTNTDAEGRLVLGDALAYGCKTYKPAAVIDLATLTGGVVVALGPYCAGIFCGDTELRAHLFDAADDTGERLWHLPLWDEHREMMKGIHSDIVNSSRAGRGAHPIQGAAFLSSFAAPDADPTRPGDLPWAHLDIAGVAETEKDTALFAQGPTGFGVRLVTRAVETWVARGRAD